MTVSSIKPGEGSCQSHPTVTVAPNGPSAGTTTKPEVCSVRLLDAAASFETATPSPAVCGNAVCPVTAALAVTRGADHSVAKSGASTNPSGFGARCCRMLALHPAFSPFHFVCFLMASYMAICLVVYFNTLGTHVLLYFVGTAKEEVGQKLTQLTIYDELLSIPAGFIWGVLSDFVGRSFVYSSGFFLIGITIISYPFVTNFSVLVLVRLLFAIGCSACTPMMVAVLSDCSGRQRGRISGIVGLMAGLGALTAALGLFKQTIKNKEVDGIIDLDKKRFQLACCVVGGISTIFAFVFYASTRKVSINSKANSELNDAVSVAKRPRTPFSTKIVLAYRCFATSSRTAFLTGDLRIITSYALSFIARADTSITVVLIPYWVIFYYKQSSKCKIEDNILSIQFKEKCMEGHSEITKFLAVVYGANLLFAPLWGVFVDRIGSTYSRRSLENFNGEDTSPSKSSLLSKFGLKRHPIYPGFLALLITTAAIGYLYFAGDVEKRVYVMIALGMFGLGQIGVVVVGSAMASSEYVPAKHRGAISGAFSFSGSLGILIGFLATNLLIENDIKAPFLVLFLMHLFAIGITVVAILLGPSGALPRAKSVSQCAAKSSCIGENDRP